MHGGATGAEVQRLRPVSISHPEHFVNVARRRAASEEGAVFADQFENLANFRAHLDTGGSVLAFQLRPTWRICSPAARLRQGLE